MSTTKTNVPFLCIWIWIFTSCLLVTSSQNVQKEKTPILIGYLTGSLKSPSNVYYKKLGQAISGAITLAINEINKDDSVLPNHSLEMVIAETYGEELVSVRETAQLPSRNISVYIGPQETCVHEGRIAAAFNIPMISYVSTSLCINFLCTCTYFYMYNNVYVLISDRAVNLLPGSFLHRVLTWNIPSSQCSPFQSYWVQIEYIFQSMKPLKPALQWNTCPQIIWWRVAVWISMDISTSMHFCEGDQQNCRAFPQLKCCV